MVKMWQGIGANPRKLRRQHHEYSKRIKDKLKNWYVSRDFASS